MNRSIRTRILLFLLLSEGLLTAVCASALVLYVQRARVAVFHAELDHRITTLLTAVQVAEEQPTGFEFSPEPNTLSPGDLFVVRDSKGHVIAASPGRPRMLGEIPKRRTDLVFGFSGVEYRGTIQPAARLLGENDDEDNRPAPLVSIAYAMPAGEFNEGSQRVIAIAVLGSLFWIVSSSLAAAFSITRGISPLNELAQQASTITARSWALSLSARVRKVSELSSLATALEELLFRLRSAFERERTFVSDAAHEMKTVVAIQKSSLQVALQGEGSARQYKGGLERALYDVDRMENLVYRMLSLASVEGAVHIRKIEIVSIQDTLLAACDQLQPLAAARDVRFELQLDSSCHVQGDEALLQTLWGAFLENAIRYSPSGCSVTIATSSQGGDCVVRIEDRGSGMAQEDLPHIFDRFYRADASRSRETGGFGLGLAIAKAIAERIDGTIEMQSQLGHGTTVIVKLPRSRSTAAVR